MLTVTTQLDLYSFILWSNCGINIVEIILAEARGAQRIVRLFGWAIGGAVGAVV